MLFFLSEDDYCTYSKLICDYSYLGSVLDSLNGKFEKHEEFLWKYSKNKVEYIIKLKKEEWFFSVTTKRKCYSKMYYFY